MGKLPDYDPSSGINRFVWIIEQSKRVREQRKQAGRRDRFSLIERGMMAEHDQKVELDDGNRLHSLRAKYNPNRSRPTR